MDLQEAIRLHALWRLQTGEGSRADLAGADLTDANLAGAKLPGADLTDADISRADLYGADLYGANLSGANLTRADLTRADLADANLARANLTRADLSGADLAGANLARANLSGADLAGANLAGANLARAKLEDGLVLAGQRPIIQLGPVGSRCTYLVGYATDRGPYFRTGCFFGDESAFRYQVTETHGAESILALEYFAAIDFILGHCRRWGGLSPNSNPTPPTRARRIPGMEV